jgi:3-hydroxyacyl-[acyl-carrier-protein] dehydratase
MPPKPLIDLDSLDPGKLLLSRQDIYRVCPHRHEFQMLDGILLLDREHELIAGVKNIRPDEFWVRGHIPGRPILPGVLMIETAAQLVSFYVGSDPEFYREDGFMGFGGVTDVKFRGAVVPGDQLIMLSQMIEMRSRRFVGSTQGFVRGQMVYEGVIAGMWV